MVFFYLLTSVRIFHAFDFRYIAWSDWENQIGLIMTGYRENGNPFQASPTHQEILQMRSCKDTLWGQLERLDWAPFEGKCLRLDVLHTGTCKFKRMF